MKKVTISPAVAAVLAGATVDGNIVRLPEGQLERSLYVAVDKVLKALGGKWNRGARGHVFASGIEGQLADALAAGHAIDQKRSLEQFFTPPDLAARMAQLARIQPTDEILEPSAGAGALIRAALAAGARPRAIWAYEIDPALRDRLRTEFAACFEGSISGLGDDFLETQGAAVFDVVLMNPPFSRNQDILHVLRAFDRLAPGGRLVAVMSAHFTFAKDRESVEFRRFAARTGGYTIDLPAGTFREAETLVNAVLFVVTKEG